MKTDPYRRLESTELEGYLYTSLRLGLERSTAKSLFIGRLLSSEGNHYSDLLVISGKSEANCIHERREVRLC